VVLFSISFLKDAAYATRGPKMVLFVTGLCGKNCFYCPVSYERREKDIIFANERRVSRDEDLVKKPFDGRPGNRNNRR